MKLPSLSVGLLALLSVSSVFVYAADTDLLPVEIFARWPAIAHPSLSRDGKTIAYGATHERDSALVFLNLETNKTNAVEIPSWSGIGRPTWVGNDRVTYGYLSAIDRNGKNYAGLIGAAREFRDDDKRYDQQRLIGGGIIFDRFEGGNDANVLITEFDRPNSFGRYSFVYLTYPHVTRMDSKTGSFQRHLDNPGKVIGWEVDPKGRVLVGVEFERGMSRVIYRPDENSGWRPLKGLEFAMRRVQTLGLNSDATKLYLAMVTQEGTWGIYAYDLKNQALGDLILSHDRYDIRPYSGTVNIDGYGLQTMVFAPKTRELLGVRYVTELPKVVWFDPQMNAYQSSLDQALPKKVNTIVSMSDDLKKFVVLSWTAQDPGTYYLFDVEKPELRLLFPRSPWVKAEQMAEVFPASYKARDGLTIRGYLTVPKGKQAKNLPLVVMPHGGPFLRDSWEFDYDAQFLASRGYAVLQMNYRGSVGFGEAFYEKGKRRIGREMQDDIEDGTRWAIEKGIADPKRIAIMGGSFGGYSAMMGVTRTPDLYRCAINIAGVSDWPALLRYDAEVNPLGNEVRSENIGDFAKDATELADISPVNHVDKIRVPLLLIYSKEDLTVPFEQARLLTNALDKAGKKYEYLSRFNEGHGFSDFKNRVQMFKQIEDFLAKNMSADPIPAVAAK